MAVLKRSKDILLEIENDFPTMSIVKRFVSITENIYGTWKKLIIYYNKDGYVFLRIWRQYGEIDE